MTAVQNSEKNFCYEQVFEVQKSNHYTVVGHADDNKLLIILLFNNWVSLSIFKNTMSSLLSMALASLIQPYKKIRLHVSSLCIE